MLDLGSTDFHLPVSGFGASDLKRISNSIFDDWEATIASSLSLPDYSLALTVEEGSVKGVAKIGAALGAIYVGIGNYGDFVSGLETINQQLRSARSYVAIHAAQAFSCPIAQAKSRQRSGTLGSLERLFEKVRTGELTSAEAAARAEKLIGQDAGESPGFLESLRTAFGNCPKYPEQKDLDLGDFEEQQFEDSSATVPRKPRRTPIPPDPSLHYRIEVWRDSRKKRKHTKVSQV